MHMTRTTALEQLRELAKERNRAMWGHWLGKPKGSPTGMDWLPDAHTRETLYEIYKVLAFKDTVRRIPKYAEVLWLELEVRYEY